MINHSESRSFVTRDLLNNHNSCKQLQLPEFKPEKHYFKKSMLQDLNQPPEPLNLLNDTSLDLKLVSISSSSPPPYTLGKVKFALERAEKEMITKKRSISTSSFKETKVDNEAYAAGCPSCLLYVLISRTNPKCPSCNMIVPSTTTIKKPRIDLSFTI
uniref:protein GL2-INTERACTING REPRESSOR 1-like n=1 Tax=Erigeron canadensis TaxID=72917 RepID=UPI001CB99CE6|nr:protein GL2-INTERACTING REPRESSOR 1-like [Erigeron canadensis]